MKVIVTGASGFVGQRVVRELLRRGVKTCAVARHPVEFPDSLVVDNYFDTPSGDILIHLAENPNRAKVNEIGSAYLSRAGALANSLVSKGYQRIVYASSAVVYGDKDKRSHKPNDPVLATDVYSRSKLECEMLFDKNNGVIARISNLYGVGMSTENVFSKIIQQVRCAGEIKVWNDKPIRDFLLVDDAVDALVEMALGKAKGIYNLGSNSSLSKEKFAYIFAKILKKKLYYEAVSSKRTSVFRPHNLTMNVIKIEKKLKVNMPSPKKVINNLIKENMIYENFRN